MKYLLVLGMAATSLVAVACGSTSSDTNGVSPGTGDDADAGASVGDDDASSDATIAPANDAGAHDADASHDATPDAIADADFDGNVLGHTPYPSVALHGGSALSSIKLVSIVAGNETHATDLLAFGDALKTSTWWTTVAAPYSLGAIVSHTKLTGANMSGTMTGAAIEQYITDTLTAQSQPAPDGHTIYVLYLPVGIWAVDDSSGNVNTNCSLFGGYHYYGSNDSKMLYAMVQQCTPGGIGGLTTLLEETTQAASHEILEAATDPFPLPNYYGYSLACSGAPPTCSPWSYSPAQPGEVGDLCAWTVYEEAGWKYTRGWSNAAAKKGDPCVPAISDAYVCAGTTKDWYPIVAGKTAQIPLVGWSTAPVSPWQAFAYVSVPSIQGFSVSPTSWMTMSAGGTSTITVTAPAGAQSGDYAVIGVNSYTASEIHPWSVGVYVQ